MVGILVSFWDDLFAGAMLVSGRVESVLINSIMWSFSSVFPVESEGTKLRYAEGPAG